MNYRDFKLTFFSVCDKVTNLESRPGLVALGERCQADYIDWFVVAEDWLTGRRWRLNVTTTLKHRVFEEELESVPKKVSDLVASIRKCYATEPEHIQPWDSKSWEEVFSPFRGV